MSPIGRRVNFGYRLPSESDDEPSLQSCTARRAPREIRPAGPSALAGRAAEPNALQREPAQQRVWLSSHPIPPLSPHPPLSNSAGSRAAPPLPPPPLLHRPSTVHPAIRSQSRSKRDSSHACFKHLDHLNRPILRLPCRGCRGPSIDPASFARIFITHQSSSFSSPSVRNRLPDPHHFLASIFTPRSHYTCCDLASAVSSHSLEALLHLHPHPLPSLVKQGSAIRRIHRLSAEQPSPSLTTSELVPLASLCFGRHRSRYPASHPLRASRSTS
ncbi:hypothetical protein PANT_18c00035 [Moesziomyces antarcticus T-34]|uniref:Uncharacterized protein n=1 Tax=Pseudozyma antarctica (strain T-34) TaxID=1151754 RepID=M9MH26_PSEA3|nr:hypothetical protein PANT_18c00035 [Moesziomyces antarcticus T-34]